MKKPNPFTCLVLMIFSRTFDMGTAYVSFLTNRLEFLQHEINRQLVAVFLGGSPLRYVLTDVLWFSITFFLLYDGSMHKDKDKKLIWFGGLTLFFYITIGGVIGTIANIVFGWR